MTDLPGKAESLLEDQTAETVKTVLEKEHPNDTFTVIPRYLSQKPIGSRRRNLSDAKSRRLQQAFNSGLEVQVQLFIETRSPTTYTAAILQTSVGKAFDSNDELKNFINALQVKDGSFSPIQDMTVSINDKPVPKQVGGGSSWLYIGLGVGGSAIAIAAFLFIGYRRRLRNDDPFVNNQQSSGGSDSPDVGPGQ